MDWKRYLVTPRSVTGLGCQVRYLKPRAKGSTALDILYGRNGAARAPLIGVVAVPANLTKPGIWDPRSSRVQVKSTFAVVYGPTYSVRLPYTEPVPMCAN